jgi:asparaginyl-tRNA synthetase
MPRYASLTRSSRPSKNAQSNDFYHVHTPILTSSDCEGAGEAFRVLSSADLSAPRKQPPTQPQFFTHPSYLTVSSQLHLEALSSSLSRVYTLSPTFRAEKSLTNRHLSEFYMLEAEMSFSDKLEDVMGLVEGCIKYSLKGVIESAKDEIEIFRKRLEDGGLPPDFLSVYSDSFLSDPWPSITYTRAIHELLSHQSANPLAFRFPVEWGLGLQSEHERWLAEELIGGPVFVTDYPASLKPFYMRLNDSLPGTEERGPTVGCFDLLLPRIGELVGGSLREERLSYLERALSEHNLSPKEYEWYLDLRRYGTVKHGGFGLGFERFVSLATGLESVRECTAFPRWGGKTIL